MNKRKTIAIISIISIVLVGVIGTILIASFQEASEEVYLKQMDLAVKYLEANDYENAILCLHEAIKVDDKQPDAYVLLAKVYREKGEIEFALSILQLGYSRSSTAAIETAIIKYALLIDEAFREVGLNYEIFETNAEHIDNHDSADKVNVTFNQTLLNEFASSNYEAYSSRYTIVSERMEGLEKYIVKYSGLNIEFIYENTNADKNVIDRRQGKPRADAMPNEILLGDLTLMIAEAQNGIEFRVLKTLGIYNHRVEYDRQLSKHMLIFDYFNCRFTVESDQNGNIKSKAAFCRIVPFSKGSVAPGEQASNSDTQVFVISGRVFDVTTSNNVPGAVLKFREGRNSKTSPVIQEVRTQEGSYQVELAQGDYTVEVIANGYSTEYFEINVISNTEINVNEENFGISPVLAAGEIRIVLEWDSMPRDLDSHLVGTTSGGQNIHVYYVNQTAYVGNQLVAELDVDKTTGFGPETITLHDIGGSFKYIVYRFSSSGTIGESGASIKIYLPNQSQPMKITPPENVDDKEWEVFTLNNGIVSDINGVVIS